MKRRLIISNFAQVNGRKPKSLRSEVFKRLCNGRKAYGARKPSRKHKRTFARILSDDFAAVDLREEPCNNGLPEKGKLTEEGRKGAKETNNKTVRRAAKDKAAVLQAGQRKTLPFRRAVWQFFSEEV